MPMPQNTISNHSQFARPLLKGRLIKRYKRFFADVLLDNGELVTAHCPNTGKMTGCAEPGFIAWVQPNDNPKRKLKYTLELVQNTQGHWIGVNTHRANAVVFAALQAQKITQFTDVIHIQKEVSYGQEKSKIDFLLTCTDNSQIYVEVKSVTLHDSTNNMGFFPDTVSVRAHKHCRELMYLLQTQPKITANAPTPVPIRAVMLYLVQHTGIKSVAPATHIDPNYADLITEAKAAGVEFLSYDCFINEENIYINQQLTFS